MLDALGVRGAGSPLRAVLAGGSIAGLASALVLRRLGWDITVVERSAGPLHDRGAGLGLDVALLSRVLDGIADLPVLRPDRRAVTVLTQGGPVEWSEPRTTGSAHVAWADLYSCLAEAVGAAIVLRGREVRHVDDGHRGGATVVLDDDSRWPAHLVVAADGYRSTLRRLVDPHGAASYAGYVLWRGFLDEIDLPAAPRAQVLDGAQHIVSRPPDHLVAYGVPGPGGAALGQRRVNWGWYRAEREVDLPRLFGRAAALDPRSVPVGAVPTYVSVEIAAAAGVVWAPPWSELIEATVARRALFAAAIYEYSPAGLADGRLALVGDAAHTASPITGAGARAALEDALALGEALAGATASDVATALRSYERVRLPAVTGLVAEGRAWGARFVGTGAD